MIKLKKQLQLLLKLSCFLILFTKALSDTVEGKGSTYEEALADGQARALFVVFGDLSPKEKAIALTSNPFTSFKVKSKNKKRKEFKLTVDYQPIDGLPMYKLFLKLKKIKLNITANISTPKWVKNSLSDIGVLNGQNFTVDIKVTGLHLSLSDPFRDSVDKKFNNKEELWDAVLDFFKTTYELKTYRLVNFNKQDIVVFKSVFAVPIYPWKDNMFVRLPQKTIIKDQYKLEENIIKVKKTVVLSMEAATFAEFDKVETTLSRVSREIAFDFNRKKASLSIETFLNKDELVKFLKENKIYNQINQINYQ